MTRPLIAILARQSESAESFTTSVVAAGALYIDSVRRAGGLAVLVPPTRDHDVLAATLNRCDGLLVMGGGDVDPVLYGEEPHEKVYNVDIELDRFEIASLLWAVEHDMPTLAICRGHQVLNVALGGSLVQHMVNTPDHRARLHPVALEGGSRVARAMGTTAVNGYSSHHQAVKTIAPGLRVVGRAPDGTVEAIEHDGATWIVGVQWHPERTADSDGAQQRLFTTLVERSSSTA